MGGKLSKTSYRNAGKKNFPVRSSNGCKPSIIRQIMKPDCVKPKKTRKKKKYSRENYVNTLTLEELLLSSPSGPILNRPSPSSSSSSSSSLLSSSPPPSDLSFSERGEPSCLDKFSSKRVHPSFRKAGEGTTSFIADDTFDSVSMGRNGSGKLKKRVSFRLPKEEDVIVSSSPQHIFERDYNEL